IRTRLLSANTIEASWIKSGTALLDRVFSSTAMFERMMAKSAFITTLSTVTLDLHELTIWRPDGVAFVQNGIPRFSTHVYFRPFMPKGGTVTWDNQDYNTSMSGTQYFEVAHTEHSGRYLNVIVQMNMSQTSASTSTRMGVVIRPGTTPSGTNIQTLIHEEIVFKNYPGIERRLTVDLGKPTYGALSFQMEFYRIGGTNENTVQVRTMRSWISG